jgi:hypothetical protein
MRTRLRLGAVSAVALGALLLATVLASPALAWHSNVTVNARCLDGKVRVHYKVEAWEKDHEATVEVSYELNGKVTPVESDHHYFAPHHNQFSGHFDLPAGTTGKITFTAVAHWDSGEKSKDHGSDELPPADKCEEDEEVPPTSAPEDTTPTTEVVAPGTSVTPTTEGEDVLGSSTTTTTGQLPFTGASSGPMLLAGIALVGGGFVFLYVSRTRGRHAAR